jgi:hypothetical protein
VVDVEVVAELGLVREPQLALGALMHAHAASVVAATGRAQPRRYPFGNDQP